MRAFQRRGKDCGKMVADGSDGGASVVPPKMLTGRYVRPEGEGCDGEVKSWGVGEKRESWVCRSLRGRQLVAVTGHNDDRFILHQPTYLSLGFWFRALGRR